MLFFNQRITLLVFGLSLVAYELMIHWFFAYSARIQLSSQFFQLLPPQLKAFLGEEELGFLSPLGMMSIGYTHPMIFTLFTVFPASLFGREIASSREKGILELTLGRPISRTDYLLTLMTFYLAGLAYLGLSIIIGSWVSLQVFNLPHSAAAFFPVVLNLVCLFVLVGNVSMYICVKANIFSRAIGGIIGFTLGLYFLEYIGRTIPLIGKTSVINPFHYYRPQSILAAGEYPLLNMIILVLGGAVFFIMSVYRFRRRDL